MNAVELGRFLRGLAFECFVNEQRRAGAWYSVEINFGGIIYRWYKLGV